MLTDRVTLVIKIGIAENQYTGDYFPYMILRRVRPNRVNYAVRE